MKKGYVYLVKGGYWDGHLVVGTGFPSDFWPDKFKCRAENDFIYAFYERELIEIGEL